MPVEVPPEAEPLIRQIREISQAQGELYRIMLETPYAARAQVRYRLLMLKVRRSRLEMQLQRLGVEANLRKLRRFGRSSFTLPLIGGRL